MKAIGAATALAWVILTVQQGAATCTDSFYVGFDTRLAATIAARPPLQKTPVTAFEMAGTRPVIAQGTFLTTVDGSRPASVDLKMPLRSILVDDQRKVTLQSADGIYRLTATAPELVRRLPGGRLFNSGTSFMLEARQEATETQFTVHRDDGSTFKLASLPGLLRTASWNRQGLAAVVGSMLVAWTAGSKDFVRLANDAGLSRAQDVVLIGPDRAVVSLGKSLVLLSPDARLMLGSVQARIRWDGTALHVLDEPRGLVWSLTGLERVGTRAADEAYARALIEALPAAAPESHTAFLEAARIVGCDAARQLRADRSRAPASR